MISVAPATGRSGPEICETGEQGGSVVGLRFASMTGMSDRFLWLLLGLSTIMNELLTRESSPCAVTIGPLLSQSGKGHG